MGCDQECLEFGGDAVCPRCGYRLDGEMARWSEACALRGVCAECGLSFDWSWILAPLLHLPHWSFEHAAPSKLRSALVATTIRLWRPKRFWTEMPLTAPINRLRLVFLTVWAILLLFTLLLLANVGTSCAYFGQFQRGAQDIPIISMSRVYGADGSTRRLRELLRPADLPSPLPLIWSGLQTPRHPNVVIDAVLPGDPGWVYQVRVPGGGRRLSSVLHAAGFSIVDPRQGVEGAALAGGALGIFTLTSMAASFVLLPVTRQRCRVRFRHVGRVYVYGLPAVMLHPLLVFPIVLVLGEALVRSGAQAVVDVRMLTSAVLFLAPSAFAYVWWSRAMSCHLQLPRPWLVSTVLCVMTLLGCFVAFAWISVV